MLNPFQFSDKEFFFRHAPEPIDAAIDEYPAIIKGMRGNNEAAPYNSDSMAEIYHPRVRKLMDLQSQGFTHAAWGRLNVSKENTWHGASPDAPEVTPTAKSEPEARKQIARYSN